VSGAEPSATKPNAQKATPKNRKPIPAEKHPVLRRVFKWTLITGAVLFVAACITAYIVYRSVDIPDANAEFQTETTHVYYSDGKHEIGTFETQNRESVKLSDVPEAMQQAIIAAEDRSFFTNNGIDIKGIIRAARNNATTDTTQGASTITQQYVKVLYLTQERSLTRKAREAILSIKIHNQLSKEQILEGYLNTIYFGNGAYGVQAAAETYFGIDSDGLGVRQSAALSAIINSPGRFDPYAGKDSRRYLKERYAYVIDGMASAGNITADEAAKYAKKLPKFAKLVTSNRFGGAEGYLLRLTEQQLSKEGFSDSQINGGGLDVVTTFDYEGQQAAVDTVKEQRPDDLKGLHVALSSVEPGTGAVRAMVGGEDYVENQLNWATSGAQPGSTFKAFALAAALSNGYGLQSTLNGNSPLTVPGGTVDNQGDSGGESFGTVTLLEATRQSINTAFVDLTLQMEDGQEKILKAANDAGLPLSVVNNIDSAAYVVPLGFAPVPNVDMANAYATFANDGKENDWYVIDSVEDPKGNTLFKHKNKERRAFSSDVAADVTFALQGVVDSGTGVNGNTVCPTAGKTGTATAQGRKEENSHVSSSWFVGFTPKLSTAVMYVRGKNGNGDLQYQNVERGDFAPYMPTFYGGQFPALTFAAFMDQAVDADNCGTFPPAANIVAETGTTYVPPTTTAPTTTAPTTTPPPETKTTEPEPTETKTTEPEPTETKTTKPEPTETKTTKPEPTETETTKTEPTETETTKKNRGGGPGSDEGGDQTPGS